jgi:acetylornithine deacetylase/succinyl-diaminopimelate desuccinylase-like protein
VTEAPGSTIGAGGPLSLETLRSRVAAEFPALQAELERLVRIPSVSSPAFDQVQVLRSAEAVAALLRGADLPEVRIVSVTDSDGRQGSPAVIARRRGPAGAPTVLLYAHHDVQPPGVDSEWVTPAFTPVELDGRLYGRGAADDKAGVIAHLGAIRVLGDAMPVSLTVFVEGEEEVGSPTFGEFLRTHRDLLAADVIVVADSANWRVGVPALTTSLRGLADCVVEVAVLDHAIHSGMYGGPVLDAVTLLARLIATLHDDAGDVAVAGLTSADDPSVEYDESEFRTDSGLLDGIRLAGSGPIAAGMWTRPAIAVIGLDATSVAAASNTLAPRARAKLSIRVAPGGDPVAALAAVTAHLEERAPFGAQVTVTPGETGKPFLAPADSRAMRAARGAFEAAWGTPPVDIGIGGSIPFIADLMTQFPDAEILVTGVEDPDSRAHGANESVHLAELQKVILAEALLLQNLAEPV